MTQHEMRRIAMQAIYLANQGNLTNAEEVCQKALKALELKSFPDYSTENSKMVSWLTKSA